MCHASTFQALLTLHVNWTDSSKRSSPKSRIVIMHEGIELTRSLFARKKNNNSRSLSKVVALENSCFITLILHVGVFSLAQLLASDPLRVGVPLVPLKTELAFPLRVGAVPLKTELAFRDSSNLWLFPAQST